MLKKPWFSVLASTLSRVNVDTAFLILLTHGLNTFTHLVPCHSILMCVILQFYAAGLLCSSLLSLTYLFFRFLASFHTLRSLRSGPLFGRFNDKRVSSATAGGAIAAAPPNRAWHPSPSSVVYPISRPEHPVSSQAHSFSVRNISSAAGRRPRWNFNFNFSYLVYSISSISLIALE
jgi:hypothetical protein